MNVRKVLEMDKKFTLIHVVVTAAAFSALSGWYGFMFGKEGARKELGTLIDDLRRGNPPPPHS